MPYAETQTKPKRHPLHHTYWNMLRRCNTPSSRSYADYGGRGIKVCDRWLGEQGFNNYVTDLGSKPTPSHTIDRINNDGDYEPSNVRWATSSEQNLNKRSTKHPWVTFHKASQRWAVRIHDKSYGYFDTLEDALKHRDGLL